MSNFIIILFLSGKQVSWKWGGGHQKRMIRIVFVAIHCLLSKNYRLQFFAPVNDFQQTTLSRKNLQAESQAKDSFGSKDLLGFLQQEKQLRSQTNNRGMGNLEQAAEAI